MPRRRTDSEKLAKGGIRVDQHACRIEHRDARTKLPERRFGIDRLGYRHAGHAQQYRTKLVQRKPTVCAGIVQAARSMHMHHPTQSRHAVLVERLDRDLVMDAGIEAADLEMRAAIEEHLVAQFEPLGSGERRAATAIGAAGAVPPAVPNTRRSLIARCAAPTWPCT